ncbi:hypothetical protein D3C81_2251760 [compost metagenome]
MLVFQHVVTGIFEGMYLRLRQCGLEALQEVVIEHEIAQAPAEEGRAIGERRQCLASALQQ